MDKRCIAGKKYDNSGKLVSSWTLDSEGNKVSTLPREK